MTENESSSTEVDKTLNTFSGDRHQERKIENQQSIPVIIKRIDQHQTHPDDTLEFAIMEGREQIERPWLSLLFSAIAAGLILGFAAMVVAIMKQLGIENNVSSFVDRLSIASVYPLGFIICIMSGTQLYTEHTATAVYPVLDKICSFQGLTRMLSLVAIGNLIGTFLSSVLIYFANPVIQAKQGYIQVAHHILKFEFSEILVSAILAGWLMAQGAWLFLTTRTDIEKVFLIYLVTFIIGLGGLHHSIAGSAELFSGWLFSNEIQLLSALKTISWMLLGNLIGGSIFVALLNYAHIRQLQKLS